MKSSFFHQDDVELAMQIEPKWSLTELSQAVSGWMGDLSYFFDPFMIPQMA